MRSIAPYSGLRRCAAYLVCPEAGITNGVPPLPATVRNAVNICYNVLNTIFMTTMKFTAAPKSLEKLHEEGLIIGEKTVGRLMREHHLRSQAMGKFKVQTTDSNHDFPIAPNWLNQHFDVCTKPNQVWVTDITYIRTGQGTVYLASVLDLFTRKIVGWQLGNRMKVELVSAALDKAYKAQQPDKEPYSPFRSWESICLRRIPGEAQGVSYDSQHEPPRELL